MDWVSKVDRVWFLRVLLLRIRPRSPPRPSPVCEPISSPTSRSTDNSLLRVQ
jgi:hypothetical protein